jgi:dTDP-4-amino-4,6-dideoxygalactose transaminase
MRKARFISLYYSSIGIKECLVLMKGLFCTPFLEKKLIISNLHDIIENRYKDSSAFSYSSARGAMASFLSSIGLKKNDEVIISAFTCLAVPTAVIAGGGKPVYCDIDPKSLNSTVRSIESAITSKTKVIVIQHTLGSVASVEAIVEMAKQKRIITIEDCALSIASKHKNKEIGITADAAIFSMELSKSISVGWGGILLLNNSKFKSQLIKKYSCTPNLSRLKTLRMSIQALITGFCYQRSIFSMGKYFVAIGFKTGIFKGSTPESENKGVFLHDFISVLSSPQAYLATHQWRKLDKVAKVCEENARAIMETITELGYIGLGNLGSDYYSVAPRVSILVAKRDEAISFFLSHGIEAGSWFNGPLQPLPNEDVFNYDRSNFPLAIFVADHILNIPCHYRINESDLKHIKITFKKYAKKYKNYDMVIQQELQTKYLNH